ncbi:MAG: outer membrane lipoprotein-sorting protein [Candidatus Caldatribacteriota bacterium]|nr:outer membrane lipoprotein-sorting protein [Candidatus Caldatribacteriota bacterium]
MKNKEFLVSILIVCLLFFCGIAYAGANTLTVDEIMDKVEETSPDSTSQKTISEMILIDEDGNEEIRDMLMFSQEGEDEKTSTLVRFLSPKSVEGVTLLNIDDGEKIYLYMPAYNRPRRIAGSSKGDEFMGTGLSYEDMNMDYEDKDYEKKLLEETDSEYIVEVLPAEEDVSYEKIILHIDKEKFYAKKVEFYETINELTKTLTINKIKVDDNGKVTPIEIEFTDIEEEDKTKIVIKEIEYNIELSSSFFSIRTLKKPTL